MVNHMDKIEFRKSIIRVMFEELPKNVQLDLFCELNCIMNAPCDSEEKRLYERIFKRKVVVW